MTQRVRRTSVFTGINWLIFAVLATAILPKEARAGDEIARPPSQNEPQNEPQIEPQIEPQTDPPVSPLVDHVLLFLSPEAALRNQSAEWLAANWDDQAISMLIELLRFMGDAAMKRRAIDMLQGSVCCSG